MKSKALILQMFATLLHFTQAVHTQNFNLWVQSTFLLVSKARKEPVISKPGKGNIGKRVSHRPEKLDLAGRPGGIIAAQGISVCSSFCYLTMAHTFIFMLTSMWISCYNLFFMRIPLHAHADPVGSSIRDHHGTQGQCSSAEDQL
ncbi:hypothetical protein Y1Q_0002270 [Alligator mississippiensis]|uniref:Uncharacterized protein n=1 Tax=Alligator mississippiensis TaxID=8496 RepID=A0A151MGL2_ALLMI|nr:hypothetical protein Y1Q_0002270 [Alligator mississippiensis]